MTKESKMQNTKTDFYVYLHRRADNGQVFYIGKGRLRRSNNKSLRSIHWKRTVAKYGYWIEKPQENMKEEDALLLEMWLIAKYLHLGYRLCNKTLGGDGCLGMTMSDETRRKSGAKNIGRKWTEERRLAQMEKAKGRKMSEESRKKMSIIAKERGFANRKISDRIVTSSEGKTYKSLMDARKDMAARFGFSEKSGNIGLCCNGSRGNAFGLNWAYGSERPKPPVGTRGRVIIEKTTGNYYKSASDFATCAKLIGVFIDGRTVTECLKDRRQYKGFEWSYLDED